MMNKKQLYNRIMESISKNILETLNEMAISKEQLADYDSIEIFNDTYIKVYKDGLYNLVDNDGNYLSKTWFSDIKKNNGGGVDVVINGKTRSYTDYHDIKKSDELISLVRHTDFLSYIDMKDIIVVTPYILKRPNMTRGVKIIALVKYMGEMLLLGADGNLYNMDGSLYIQVKFSVSSSDLHRLLNIADKICKKFNSEYNSNTRDDTWKNLKFRTSCFIFGFNNDNMEYSTGKYDKFINRSKCETWGGDSIKVRFFVKYIKNYDQNEFIKILQYYNFLGCKTTNSASEYVKSKTFTKECI